MTTRGELAAAAAGSAADEPVRRVDDEASLRQAMELLFFAYRDFTGEADAELARYGFGRAHHRVIYFVNRYPGATVGELLGILRITKQSLARVLGDLMRNGFVAQRADTIDRRRRRLYLTAEAVALERRLSERQMAFIAAAFRAAGGEAAAGFRLVLRAMLRDGDRRRFAPGPEVGYPAADALLQPGH